MTARFSSASSYVLDAFLIAYILLFLEGGGAFPLVLIWLALTFLTAIAVVFISWRKPYMPLPAMSAAAVIMAASMAAGVSVGIVILMIIISVYRLHARFSEIEDGSGGEGRFLVIFLLTMTFALLITLVNPATDPQNLIWALSVAALIFYTVSRLVYRYLDAKKDGAKISHVLAAGTGIVFVSGGIAVTVYLLAGEARNIAVGVLGVIIRIIFWPFAGLYEQFGDFIAENGSEDNTQGNVESESVETELFPGAEPADFNYTIGTAIVVLLLVIAGILLIRKIRTDPEEKKKEEKVAEISRFTATPEVPVEPSPVAAYNMVGLHEIRKAFREFEAEAMALKRGRMEHETIREWSSREDLPVSESFFSVYDKVRYGSSGIAANEANPFLEELEKIKSILLKENV